MINLDRLPRSDTLDNEIVNHITDQTRIANIEVLTNNKVPLSRLSTAADDEKFKCPACGNRTLDMRIDCRCCKMFCNARVIKYKTYNSSHMEHCEDEHIFYMDYIKRFYNQVKEKALGMEKNKRTFNNPK